MVTPRKLQISLLFSLCWGLGSCGGSIAPFFSTADDMASASAYHDIRHLLAESTEIGTEKETMAYFDRQGVSLNRIRLWHATTALLLATCSLSHYRRSARIDRTSSRS